MLSLFQTFSAQIFPPIKDIILTAIPVIGIPSSAYLGYVIGGTDRIERYVLKEGYNPYTGFDVYSPDF